MVYLHHQQGVIPNTPQLWARKRYTMPDTATPKTPTKTALTNALRAKVFTTLVDLLSNAGEEVLRVDSATIAIPVVDEAGNDSYAEIGVKIPKGERGGAPYDGHARAEAYAEDVERKRAEAEAKAADKAAKAKAKAAKAAE